MPVERRGWVTHGVCWVNGRPEEPSSFAGRRQPSLSGTSRMRRESHVRICERLGVKFPGPTRRGIPSSPESVLWGEGSGFFISSDGYIVTNNHVVDHAKTVTVTMDDSKVLDAKVVGTDAKTDLALLKVDQPGDYPYVNFAKDAPRIGDWVVAIGNPYGLGGTVTAGIISAEGRDIGDGPYDRFLQIDAPINKGNSGGPTFNQDGQVVGVNT